MRLRWACVLGESSSDCGAAALATVALHYGRRLNILEVQTLVETDRQGTTMENLCAGARRVGFSASCGRLDPEHLERVQLPCIVHCHTPAAGHFMVIHAVWKDVVVVADPAIGVRKLPRDDFLAAWSRRVLLLTPTPRLRSIHNRQRPLRYFFSMVRADRGLLMLSAWFAVVLTVMTYALSLFVRQIIDSVIPSSDMRLLLTLGTGFLVVVFVRAIFTVVRQFLLACATQRLTLSLGAAYVRHLVSLPVRFFETHQSGELLTRFLDASKVSVAVSGPVLSVVLDLLLLVVCGAFMLSYNVLLTLLTIAFLPAYALLVILSNVAVQRRERLIRNTFATLANRFVELITNIRFVKAYASESKAYEQLAAAHEAMQRAVFDRAVLAIALAAASTLLGGVATIGLLWVGTELVIDRQLTLGELMFFYSVSTLFLTSVDRLGVSIAVIQEASTGFERLYDVHALPSEHEGVHLGADAGHSDQTVEFKNVTFGYRTNAFVLRDVTFRISAGTTLAVLGETGSGKSTLVSLINGLYHPQHGQVLVNGRNVCDVDKTALRKRVTLVQESSLVTGTIRDNIAFGTSDPSFTRIRQAASLACADEFIRELPGGYNYEIGPGGLGLSSGQRQRIAIARALLRDPEILILDEATSNLDPSTEQQIVDTLQRGRGNRISVIATHRIAIAARADMIIVLQSGRIVECGTHRELLDQRNKYYAMWNTLAINGTVNICAV